MQRTEIVRQDDKNIIDPFLRHTKSGPTNVAIIDGAEVLTYQELWRLSKYVVHSLWDFGIRKGDRVAYFLPNGVDLIVLYLAIQAMGAVAVPVNYRFTSEEVGCLVNASDAEALIYAPEHQSVAIDARKGFDHAVQILSSQFIRDALSDMRQGGQSDSAKDFEVFQEGGPSRIQFTGGSTGAPKGAARTHAADLVEIRDILETIGLEDVEHPVALVQAPMEHHGGHSWLLSCLSAGAAVVVASKFDAEEILGKIERYAVTHIILLPPSVYCRLSREAAPGARDLSSVRIVQSAAGAMTPSIVEGIFQLFPACEINYGWGQSESGVGTSMRLSREEYASGTPKIHSVGVPMRSLEMMLLDEKGGASDCGEAVVRTPAMMEGYYERPDLTREVLQDGWLRTGDVFARDEQGLYYFKARVKDVIKTGGENVYASEVQAVILSHPEVQDCVVKGVPDLVWGEAVAAIVQPMKGSALSPKAIQDFCKRHLASYKKPQKIGLVDDLGRDESGKVGADRMNELFSLAES